MGRSTSSPADGVLQVHEQAQGSDVGKANHWNRIQVNPMASQFRPTTPGSLVFRVLLYTHITGDVKPDLHGVSTWLPPNQSEASSPTPSSCSPGAVHGDEDFQCLFLLASALIISTPSWLASFSSPSTGRGSLAAAGNGKGAEKG